MFNELNGFKPMSKLRQHLLGFLLISLVIGVPASNTFVRGFAVGYAVAALTIIAITYYPKYNKE